MKKKNRLLRFAFVLAFLVSLGLGNELWAQTSIQWDGSAGDNDWTNTANWTPAQLPVAGDDVTFVDATGLPANIPAATSLRHLTFNGTFTTIGLAGSLTITGNLTIDAGSLVTAGQTVSITGTTGIAAGASLTTSGGTKTFTGAVTNAGTLNLTGATASFAGSLTNSGTFTTDGATQLTFTGTTAVTLPSVAALGALTVNKASGNVTISGDMTLGGALAGSGGLTISNAANVDLNGNRIILSQTTNVISESSTGTVINTAPNVFATDATGTCIATAAADDGSGIGITVSAGTAQFFRFPVSGIVACNGSVTRIYNVVGTPTISTVLYKASELNGNTAGTLKIYKATNSDFTTGLVQLTSSDDGTGTVTATGGSVVVSGDYFAMVGTGGAGADMTFTGVTSNDWNVTTNWAPAGIPTCANAVTIPTGFAVTTSGAIAAKSITINGSSTLNVSKNATVAGASDGGITLNGTSALTVSAAVNFWVGDATYRGDITMNESSTLTFSGAAASFKLSGTFVKGADATITETVAPNASFVGSTNLTLPSTFTSVGTLTIDKVGASVSQSGDMTASGVVTLTNGTYIVGDYAFTASSTTSLATGTTFNGAATILKNRTFTGDVTLNGTATLNLSGLANNAFNGDASALDFGSAGGSVNLTGSTTAATGLASSFVGTINSSGATLTLNGTAGTYAFTNTTLTTDANTKLIVTAQTAAGGITLPSSVTELYSLSLDRQADADAITFGATSLTLAGDLDLVQGTLTATNKTITVNGDYTCTTTDGILSAAGATLTFNAGASFGGANADLVTDPATNFIFNTSAGTIAGFPDATGPMLFNQFTYNKPGISTTLSANAMSNAGAATPQINITSGTVVFGVTNQFVDIATTVTTISADGTLDIAALDQAFLGTVAGTGTIDASDAAADISFAAENYNFSTGNLLTSGSAAGTVLVFTKTTGATDVNVTLPSSVTALEQLDIVCAGAGNTGRTIVTLSNDLTIATAITPAAAAAGATATAAADLQSGSIVVNGYTLTLTGGIATGAATIANTEIDATASSSLVFAATTVFTNVPVTTDETTNMRFNGNQPTVTGFNFTELNNLTIATTAAAGAVSITPSAALDIYGNLTIASPSANTNTLAMTAANLTVRGDVSVNTSGVLNMTGRTLTAYGSIQGAGTYTTTAATNLIVLGTGNALQMPTGITTLGTLTLNRLNGMVLNADLAVGETNAGTVDLVITKGNLDLNGYVITLADANGTMTETAPYRVINTGATSGTQGFITTNSAAGTTNTNIIASGIGVQAMTDGTADLIVRRYPKVVPIPGIGLAVSRYYYIYDQNAGGINTSVLSLYFDNTELNSPIEGLKLYHSTSDAFTTKTETSGTLTQNSPAGKSYLAATPSAAVTSASYFALAGLPGNGGVMRTFNLASGTSGNWTTAANWSPSGVPTVNDQVVIGPYTVTIEGNGQNFYCSSLLMNHALSTLKPYDNGSTGDVVTLNVMGDVNLSAAGASIIGANGNGRLNLVIGDGATAGIASVITTPVDFAMVGTDGDGIWVNDLSVKSATVTFANATKVRVSGDVNVTGNSSMTFKNASFYGGYNGTAAQEINAESSAYLQFVNMNLENNANVTTASDFEQTNAITVASGSVFNATNGTITYPTSGITCWNILNGGTLNFNNIALTSDVNTVYTPLGDVTVKGSFAKSGASDFTATSGSVIFSNSTQKELTNTGAAADLRFYSLQVLPASAVTTSSSFEIASDIDVKTNASFKADNGTISFTQAGAPGTKWIKNVSTHTLEFNNLAITAGNTYTNDSWTIKGDLNVTTALYANNGTITFSNNQQKTITNAGTLEFFKIKLADGSKLTTATAGFTVKNNATYPSDAGIEVGANAQFTTGDAAHVTTFDAGVGMASGYPKTIVNNGTLKLGLLTISASPNNEVSTASSFEIIGTGGTAFNNAGAGANFTATAGEILFSGTAPFIASVSPAVTNFYSIASKGNTVLKLTAAQDIHVRGNITINGASSFLPGAVATSKIIFDGTTQQFVGGNTTVIDGINLGNVVLNKGTATYTTNDEVKLTANVYNSGVLTLTNGILNLGSATFKCAATPISRANGVINGGTGTYQITTGHATPKLEDVYFTIDGTPTLNNLLVDLAHTTANDLTVNGYLNLNSGAFTIATGAGNTPKWLRVKGNLLRTAGTIAGSTSLSTLILDGTGTVTGGLSNSFFGGANATVNVEIARAEVLGGNLTMAAGKNDLAINTGINSFDLAAYTLSFPNASNTLTMKSGAIKAGTGSKVTLAADALGNVIPANAFVNNEVYNLTIAKETTIKSDLAINGTWAGAFSITTGDNVLSIAKTAVIPTLTSGSYVRGNLRRVVTNTETAFPVGDGIKTLSATNYRPISLQFATIGNEQAITVRNASVDPTIGRGGNPKNAINVVWNITPEGTDANDALKAKFQWSTTPEETANGGQVALTNASFPAKWNGSSWTDYRNNLSNFVVNDPRVLTMSSFAIANPAALKGDWAIFNATANTNAAKDAAISLTMNKLVVTSVTPNPVVVNQPFKVTVQLQDQYGQPINASNEYSVSLSKHQGEGTFTAVTGVIPSGSSIATFTGLTFTEGSGANHQLIADSTGSSVNWQAGLSSAFAVLPTAPATQASNVRFTNIAPTSMTITWNDPQAASQRTIIMMKANSLLNTNEFPVNGTTYVASSVYGAGSSIGEAVVVYNANTGNLGAGDVTINVTGLAPNTKYYAYAFVYSMDDNKEGSENYKTTAASKNPNAETTIGGTDDDVAFGGNDTRLTSKTIGTNTPVTGTLASSTDEDWFNFTVTNASPNVRTQLYGLGNNYNVEVYDAAGRRIRRGIRTATGAEGPVVNDLPAGTYTVRIYSADGSYSSTNTYTLKVGTKSSEIFSVTP